MHSKDFLIVEKREDILPEAEYFAATHVDRYENLSGKYHGQFTDR